VQKPAETHCVGDPTFSWHRMVYNVLMCPFQITHSPCWRIIVKKPAQHMVGHFDENRNTEMIQKYIHVENKTMYITCAQLPVNF